MIKYKIRVSNWFEFPLIIVNFNHFFIQPAYTYIFSTRFAISMLLSTFKTFPEGKQSQKSLNVLVIFFNKNSLKALVP